MTNRREEARSQTGHRLNLLIPRDLNDQLTEVSLETSHTKTALLLKAVKLLLITYKNQEDGGQLQMIDKEGNRTIILIL